jgi:hypothetical protein
MLLLQHDAVEFDSTAVFPGAPQPEGDGCVLVPLIGWLSGRREE